MNFEEKQIIEFLKPCPRVFFSVREIGKKAGTRRQFSDNPEWPRPHLKLLAAKGHLQTNPMGQFCFVPSEERRRKPYKVGDHLKLLAPEEAAKAAREASDPDYRPFGASPAVLPPAQQAPEAGDAWPNPC
jgi:hypothetical protein